MSASLTGLLHWSQGKRVLQLLRQKITERPRGSVIGDPSAILEENEMSGWRRGCLITAPQRIPGWMCSSIHKHGCHFLLPLLV